jgi:hypothetical protein
MPACTGCAQTNFIVIRMKIGGRDIVFHRCTKCECNTWEEGGGVLSLDEVLDLARASR